MAPIHALLAIAAALAAAASSVAAAASPLASGAAATISPNTKLYLSASVPAVSAQSQVTSPLFWAVSDISRDFYKVIGTMLVQIGALPDAVAATATDTVIALSLDAAMPRESFSISLSTSAAFAVLNVTGADVRGLVYGLYHVSGDLLAVDPWWWFLDVQPAFAGVVYLPAAYSYASGMPAFYSRGAFINDEDTSGFFFADAAGDSVYSGHVAAFYCEALLRLRVNTIVPSTFAYVDERHYRVAAARGLMLGNHHVMPMGNDVMAWPKGVPYSYRLSPEPFHFMWEALTEYQQVQQGREMVYSLGYRGVNDEPFWDQDPECRTDVCRGAIITQAIANQSLIALAAAARRPDAPPPRFVSYLWMELEELFEAGTLHFPPGTATIFTDFPGSFNILGADNATKGDGFYAHIAMMSGTAAQLTEFIPLHRMFASIYAFFAKLATAYGMINTSDLKQVPISAEAVYRYMWSPASFNSTPVAPRAGWGGIHVAGPRGPIGIWPAPTAAGEAAAAGGPTESIITPAQAEAAFLLEWCTRHYGTALGTAAADLWQRYFRISYMAIDVDCTSIATCNKGDHFLGSFLRDGVAAFQLVVDNGGANATLMKELSAQANDTLAFALPNVDFVAALWGDTLSLQAQMAPGSPERTVFDGHSVMQTAVHHFHLQALSIVSLGALAYVAAGGGAPGSAAALASVTGALEFIDQALKAMREGESGVWRGVYARETWTFVVGSRADLSHLQSALQGLHSAEPPSDPYADYAIMTYECSPNDPVRCNSFPLAAFNVSTCWDVLVRASCLHDVPTAGTFPAPLPNPPAEKCVSSFTGASFSGASAHIGLFIAPHSQRAPAAWELRYTLDGSAPGPSSTLYSPDSPIVVQESANGTTVRAQAFVAGAPLGVPVLASIVHA